MNFHSDMPSLWQAALLLPFVLVIALWVSWTDLKAMKITNRAVGATLLVWLVPGWFAMPSTTLWLYGWLAFAIVLVLGFLGNMIGLFGAGDAKFAAAMAPFFIGGNVLFLLMLYACCSIGALLLHRILRRIPVVRRHTADWQSWESKKFPMGLALSGMFLFYHLAAFLPQG